MERRPSFRTRQTSKGTFSHFLHIGAREGSLKCVLNDSKPPRPCSTGVKLESHPQSVDEGWCLHVLTSRLLLVYSFRCTSFVLMTFFPCNLLSIYHQLINVKECISNHLTNLTRDVLTSDIVNAGMSRSWLLSITYQHSCFEQDTQPFFYSCIQP